MFEVYVSNDSFKFNAAHFVAFKGYRERLHGHNYRVSVRLLGRRQIGADGYVIDFGNIKDVCRKVCKRLNEHFICPIYSDVLKIDVKDSSVTIECEDGSIFQFPTQDCALLPLVHATTEELSIYLYSELLEGLNKDYLLKRGIQSMEVVVAEAPGQEATFRMDIPDDLVEGAKLDVRSFVASGGVVPMPCASSRNGGCPQCQTPTKNLSEQLHKLAKAINDGDLTLSNDKLVTSKDLEKLLI